METFGVFVVLSVSVAADGVVYFEKCNPSYFTM